MPPRRGHGTSLSLGRGSTIPRKRSERRRNTRDVVVVMPRFRLQVDRTDNIAMS